MTNLRRFLACAPALGKSSRFLRRGQTLVEYALILAIISVVAVGVMKALGSSVKVVYSAITSNVASAQASH
jgi:Flp pilus assembly pilin Flp